MTDLRQHFFKPSVCTICPLAYAVCFIFSLSPTGRIQTNLQKGAHPACADSVMKPISSWNFTPYTPLDRPERALNPYICRVAPGMTTLAFDFIDNGADAKATHTVCYRTRETEEQPAGDWISLYVENAACGQLCRLKPKTDYEFYVERDRDCAGC